MVNLAISYSAPHWNIRTPLVRIVTQKVGDLRGRAAERFQLRFRCRAVEADTEMLRDVLIRRVGETQPKIVVGEPECRSAMLYFVANRGIELADVLYHQRLPDALTAKSTAGGNHRK